MSHVQRRRRRRLLGLSEWEHRKTLELHPELAEQARSSAGAGAAHNGWSWAADRWSYVGGSTVVGGPKDPHGGWYWVGTDVVTSLPPVVVASAVPVPKDTAAPVASAQLEYASVPGGLGTRAAIVGAVAVGLYLMLRR